MANPSYFWLIEEGRTHPKLGCIHKIHRQISLIFTPSPLFEYRKKILVLRLEDSVARNYEIHPPKGGRFWWTESPLKSAQKSTRESRSTQKSALESKCTLESAQRSAQTSSAALTRAQKIALRSKSLKRVLKRVCYSIKCSGEWVSQMSEPLKRVRYS